MINLLTSKVLIAGVLSLVFGYGNGTGASEIQENSTAEPIENFSEITCNDPNQVKFDKFIIVKDGDNKLSAYSMSSSDGERVPSINNNAYSLIESEDISYKNDEINISKISGAIERYGIFFFSEAFNINASIKLGDGKLSIIGIRDLSAHAAMPTLELLDCTITR